jgi:hypothetical protein
MTGLFLVIFGMLGILFFAISFLDDYNEEEWKLASIVAFALMAIWIIAIPISRIDSKTNAEYVKILQETIDENRINQQEFSVLERTAIIEEINSCNQKITTWKTKGQKWYNNKWYYHPSVKEAKYLK